jgi:hypothetical protein
MGIPYVTGRRVPSEPCISTVRYADGSIRYSVRVAVIGRVRSSWHGEIEVAREARDAYLDERARLAAEARAPLASIDELLGLDVDERRERFGRPIDLDPIAYLASVIRRELGRDLTLDECGQLWGVTRERIRQIEIKALDKLRRRPEGRALRVYLEGRC